MQIAIIQTEAADVKINICVILKIFGHDCTMVWQRAAGELITSPQGTGQGCVQYMIRTCIETEPVFSLVAWEASDVWGPKQKERERFVLCVVQDSRIVKQPMGSSRGLRWKVKT